LKFENLTVVILDRVLIFDGRRIEILTFDLKHINYGWNKINKEYNLKKRSDYRADDIVFIFNLLVNYNFKSDTANKIEVIIKQKHYTRYIIYFIDPWSAKTKKTVIDIDFEFNNKAIILTIY
jgi:hypothetical protein